MNSPKDDNKEKDLNSSKGITHYIQNFNAPVGVVQNSPHSIANVDQHSADGSNDQAPIVAPVKMLVERFLRVYESHGIRANQIPAFAARFNLKLSDFLTYRTVLNVMNEDLIEWTCETFNVAKAWLEGEPGWTDGVTDNIYKYFDCYKSLYRIIELFEDYKNRPRDICLFAFKNGELKRDTINESIAALVFREKIGELNERDVYRYKPITTHWQWDYFKMRFELKGIFLLCKKHDVEIRGYDLPDAVIDRLVDQKEFPEAIVGQCRQRSWYPEDYVASPSESRTAEEFEELNEVLEYLRDCGYYEF